MTRTDRIRVALTLVLIWQLWQWTDLTSDTASLVWSSAVLVIVAGVGKVCESLDLHQLITTVVQVLVGAALFLLAAGLGYGWPRALDIDGVVDAVIRSASGNPPIPPSLGETVIVVGLATLTAIVAERLVVATDQAWLAAVPVFTPYAVVGVSLPTAASFSGFAGAAVGFVVVLVAAGPAGSAARTMRRSLTAAVVTALALGLTWVIVGRLPELTPPSSGAPVRMSDPSLDLKRNLVRGSTAVVITYTTDQDTPVRLKLATLPRLGDRGFTLQDVRLSRGSLPRPPGLLGRGSDRSTAVRSTGFASEWLPVPVAPRSVEAAGTWGHTVDSLDVLSLAERGRTAATLGLDYTVQSTDVTPSADAIAQAGTSLADGREELIALPESLDPRIASLAREITADAPTAGAAAQAIEAYLRSDLFTYDLTVQEDGDSLGTLSDFLFTSRHGYCEQFAGSMAVLARARGIPARIAVGFGPGRQREDGTWELTARDMHTWPELWLDGWGWVGFEPTPSSGSRPTAGGTPATARPTTTPGASATPRPATTTPAPAPPTSSVAPTVAPTDPEPATSTGAWGAALLAVLLVVALGAVGLLAPRLARRLRRRRRLRSTGDARADTLSAWAEIQESVTDAGYAWPPGSPRFVAAALRDDLPDESTREALDRMSVVAELALFDRPDAALPPLPRDDVRVLLEGLSRSRRTRRADHHV